jgi:hypothetical protein
MRYTTLERAFQLAQNGSTSNLSEIRAALKAEGYSDAQAQTSFASVRKQLRNAVQKRLGASPTALRRARILGVLHLHHQRFSLST